LGNLKVEFINQISVIFDEKIANLRSKSEDGLQLLGGVIQCLAEYSKTFDEENWIVKLLDSFDS
jgi:hypothetical protein